MSGLLVVPRIHLQTAFDENRPSFFQVFTSNLSEARPQHDIDISDFLTSFSAVSCVNTIDRDAEVADRAALGRVTHLWVAGEVPEQDDFVEASHALVITKLFCLRQLFRWLLSLFG